MHEITVRLGTWGWMVGAADRVEYFQTGAQAERRARDLARGLAAKGWAVKLKILDMRDGLVACLDFEPRRREAA